MVWTIMLVETLFAEQLSIIQDLFHAVLLIEDLCVPCEFLFVRSSLYIRTEEQTHRNQLYMPPRKMPHKLVGLWGIAKSMSLSYSARRVKRLKSVIVRSLSMLLR